MSISQTSYHLRRCGVSRDMIFMDILIIRGESDSLAMIDCTYTYLGLSLLLHRPPQCRLVRRANAEKEGVFNWKGYRNC